MDNCRPLTHAIGATLSIGLLGALAACSAAKPEMTLRRRRRPRSDGARL